MISHIDTSGINLDLPEDFKKYVLKKIGRLDRYMPRHARKSVHADAKIREVNQRFGNKYECEVILHLPGETITAKEATLNMFAGVDILEEKLKNQLKRYKELHSDHRGKHGFLARFKRRTAPVEVLSVE